MGNYKEFLWGSATASYQCEGAYNQDGRGVSMWDHYLHTNNFEDGNEASNHYNMYQEDIRLIKEGSQNTYRFSIAWPRIFPNGTGEVNQKGIEFYHKLIDELLANNIVPFVTIYHWDLPQSLEEKGGWVNKETCEAYLELVKVIFNEYGDKVKHWVTFNEPRFFTFSGYKIGNYPPAINNTGMYMKAAYNVMYASALAVREYKSRGLDGRIGVVHSFAPVNGENDSNECKEAVRNADNFFNNWVLDTAIRGEFPEDMLNKLSKKYDLSFIKSEELEVIKNNTVDFVGLNYYARALVKEYTEGETVLRINNAGKSAKGQTKIVVKDWFEQVFDPRSIYTEWDTEVYPRGLYEGIMMVWEKYGVPIFITENGFATYEDINVDMVNDDYRIDFLNDHIAEVLNAIDDGANVEGYYVWSTMDLYSWKNGHDKRYGLVAVDFDNGFKRKPKASYYWYKKVIESNGNIIKR